MSELAFPIPDELLEAIAERVAELLDVREPRELSPYLSVVEAAEYLRCPTDPKTGKVRCQRVYDLLSDGRLTRFKDGSRVLVAPAELERYLGVDTGPATPLPARVREARK